MADRENDGEEEDSMLSQHTKHGIHGLQRLGEYLGELGESPRGIDDFRV